MKRTLLLLIKIALAVAAAGGPFSYAAPPAGVAISAQAHPQDVMNITIGTEPGTHVPTGIVRNGKQASLDVQLGPVPAQQAGLVSFSGATHASQSGFPVG